MKTNMARLTPPLDTEHKKIVKDTLETLQGYILAMHALALTDADKTRRDLANKTVDDARSMIDLCAKFIGVQVISIDQYRKNAREREALEVWYRNAHPEEANGGNHQVQT